MRNQLDIMHPSAWHGFILVPENLSAVDSVKSVAYDLANGNRPSTNPLFIHGGLGCGKTHLAHSLTAELASNSIGTTARTISAGGIKWNDNSGATDHTTDLMECDLLVIEDVQHLPARAVESFSKIWDARIPRRRQILITSNVGPASLNQLPRRLTSRLSAGLIVEMAPFCPISRKILISASAQKHGLSLADDAILWLSQQRMGLRELLGLLKTLAVLIPQRPLPTDQLDVETLLRDNGQILAAEVGIQEIVTRVASAFQVSEKEILGVSRLREIMLPRHVAMYLGRQVLGQSLPRLGKAFGGKDHTTVLHACRKIAATLSVDAKLDGMVRRLQTELGLHK